MVSYKWTLGCALCTLAVIGTAEAKPAKKPEEKGIWRVSTGFNYSTGAYGDTVNTDIISVPIGVRYARGPLSVRVSIPYLHLRGPGTIEDSPQGGGNGSGGTVVGSTLPVRRASGFGDTSVALGYSLEIAKDLSLDGTARVKFPTGSTRKGLSSDRVDVITELELVKSIGKFSLSAGGSRRFTGQSDISPARNVWGASVGANMRTGKVVMLGADFDWREASTAGNPSIREVTGWASIRLSKKLRLSINAGTGFGRNSSDFFCGTGLSWRIN